MLTGSHIVCLQLIRLDLYYAELSTTGSTSFSLSMLPSDTLQFASSFSAGDLDQISLLPSASSRDVWIKLDSHLYHLIRLIGEEETAVLGAELREGLPLIGQLDGDRDRPVDMKVWRDNDRGSLRLEITAKGAEKVEGVVDMEMNRGPPVYGDVKLFTKSDGSLGYSITMVMEDFTVVMLKSKGSVIIIDTPIITHIV